MFQWNSSWIKNRINPVSFGVIWCRPLPLEVLDLLNTRRSSDVEASAYRGIEVRLSFGTRRVFCCFCLLLIFIDIKY